MSNVDHIIIEHLKAIRASQDRLEFEVKEVKARITHLESAADIYRQQATIDRVIDRVDRLEKLVQNVST